jgi:hypothetical protein
LMLIGMSQGCHPRHSLALPQPPMSSRTSRSSPATTRAGDAREGVIGGTVREISSQKRQIAADQNAR